MIGAVLALGIVAPARAGIISGPGLYEVRGDTPASGYVNFYFTGGVLNPLDASWAYTFASATINGQSFTVNSNINCPSGPIDCTPHQFGSPFVFVEYSASARLLNVDFSIDGYPSDYHLNYAVPDGNYVALAGAVPEPSTWAMLLIGFAGIGFTAYRSRNKLEYAARA
jgi:hypothetical protein